MPPKSIIDLRDVEINIQNVPLGAIELDPMNPNDVDEEKMAGLERAIKERGFNQPVLLWERGEDDYRMIDGEHRYLLLQKLGARSIPSIVSKAASEDDARIELLQMNHLRGEFVPIRLAQMLNELQQRIPAKELRRMIGMEEGQFRDSLRLATFTDPVEEKLKEAIQREGRDAVRTVAFVLTPAQAEVVEAAIEQEVAGGAEDRGAALVALCQPRG